ncbi:hypothetical protein EVAR_59141_1 [Eumeta japonica]|uniref:Uncharacterized protein n=1 Tax=Eumeta variegata TaxID=151549 RepID=A0A4C1Z8I6_EUMVA|nr:hypothetical protein EVAR_59141_1 [Eumeta japonica]
MKPSADKFDAHLPGIFIVAPDRIQRKQSFRIRVAIKSYSGSTSKFRGRDNNIEFRSFAEVGTRWHFVSYEVSARRQIKYPDRLETGGVPMRNPAQ